MCSAATLTNRPTSYQARNVAGFLFALQTVNSALESKPSTNRGYIMTMFDTINSVLAGLMILAVIWEGLK